MLWKKIVNHETRAKIEDLVHLLDSLPPYTLFGGEPFFHSNLKKSLGVWHEGSGFFLFKIDSLVVKYTRTENEEFIPDEYWNQDEVTKLTFNSDLKIINTLKDSPLVPSIYAIDKHCIVLEELDNKNLEELVYSCNTLTEAEEYLEEIAPKIILLFTNFINQGVLPCNILFDNFYFDSKGNLQLINFSDFQLIQELKDNNILLVNFKKSSHIIAKEFWANIYNQEYKILKQFFEEGGCDQDTLTKLLQQCSV